MSKKFARNWMYGKADQSPEDYKEFMDKMTPKERALYLAFEEEWAGAKPRKRLSTKKKRESYQRANLQRRDALNMSTPFYDVVKNPNNPKTLGQYSIKVTINKKDYPKGGVS